jgi:hypothetical protein
VADVQRRAVYADETSHIRYRTYVPRVSRLLLRGFCWRLYRKYLVDDTHPLVGLYALGAVAVGGGVASVRRGRGTAAVMLVLGWLCWLFAMAADRRENRSLDLVVTREEHEPPAEAGEAVGPASVPD